MNSRRHFFKALATGGVGLFIRGNSGVALARLAGGSLNPQRIPKYRAPMLIPPVMPLAETVTDESGGRVDYYEISVKQFSQQILPPGFPETTVWGYGPAASKSKRGTLIHNAPSLTIEAKWGAPVRVKWINDLVDATGNYLPHLLPVDPTLHWANPGGGQAGRDSRPKLTSTPGRYKGPVPLVTHVHGAASVGDESDGYPEAWFLPDAANIPAGFAAEGTWYRFFADKAAAKFGASWGPGFAVGQYPNRHRAATLWYHDHVLGMTRLNFYAGLAGFYLIRGGPDGDGAVLDSRSGKPAVLPGPAPQADDAFPSDKTYYELPIVIQDRSFNADGSLFYPDTRAFFDKITGPFLPRGDISPIWNPEFFGNTIMVNGKVWPFQRVERRRYRMRILNGCQTRFLILSFAGIPGVDVWQIGNEGGFLERPVNLTADHHNHALLAPAERADLIVDFTNVPVGNYVLKNAGPDEPFDGSGSDSTMADPSTTGQILQFRVVGAARSDPTTPPSSLQLPLIRSLPSSTVTRRLALLEEESAAFKDKPSVTLLGTVAGDPNVGPSAWTKALWMDDVTENPAVGATETWEMYNATDDAHPIHIHEGAFEIIDRQKITVDKKAQKVRVLAGSAPMPREPWETGFNDTFIVYPNQVTRIRIQFNTPGQFVWHCHIVEHEDNEMMRPYRVGPAQPQQPG
jgi:FtsP/CotA-like multicopper oxidase with cupredoxin domain